jgi:GNAT superfamily N-acetyltransferase
MMQACALAAPTMTGTLHNIVWHALVGSQARFAAGAGDARRYQRGVTDLIGFADAAAPDFAALRPHCDTGERFYCLGWTGPEPAGWAVEREARIVKMVWDAPEAPSPTGAPEPVALGAHHQTQAQALAELTQPGPFGARTLELGEYFGVFDGDALVAMAGERMHADRLREISAVCTHPQHQGRGLARALMLHLMRRELARGETPFLHVLGRNAVALGLYRRMGFRDFAESAVRIVRAA